MDKKKWILINERIKNYNPTQEGITTFVNNYSLITLFNCKYTFLKKIDHIHIDGIFLVKIFNFLFNRNLSRFSFDETSLAPEIFQLCSQQKKTMAIIGTEEFYLNTALKNIQEKYPKLSVVYHRNGFFDNEKKWEKCIDEIKTNNPDFVIAGMGTPMQEQLLIDLKQREWKGNGFTCGGFLHQTAQQISYYPKFFDKYNIRWIYRISDEPKLIHRYFIIYPKSLVIILYYFVKFEILKTGSKNFINN